MKEIRIAKMNHLPLTAFPFTAMFAIVFLGASILSALLRFNYWVECEDYSLSGSPKSRLNFRSNSETLSVEIPSVLACIFNIFRSSSVMIKSYIATWYASMYDSSLLLSRTSDSVICA